MLNRIEYNAAFKTDLTEEQFKEIMGDRIPITEVSQLTQIAIADKNGNAWYFLPKEKVIPIEWIEEYTKRNFPLTNGEIVLGFMADMLEDWEKENETYSNN